MAADERRVTRHEPITTTVDTVGGKELVFEARPLPWRKRNDLADVVIGLYTAATNKLISTTPQEDGSMAIDGQTFESNFDYLALFAQMYPSAKAALIDDLDFDSLIDVLVAGLTVNGLDRLEHLLDPDRKKDPTTGESEPATAAPTDAGEKTDSATDSG